MGMYVSVYECSTQEFQKVASDTIERGLHVDVNWGDIGARSKTSLFSRSRTQFQLLRPLSSLWYNIFSNQNRR